MGLLKLDVDAEGLRTLAELTLALVLFTDASNANLGVLKKNLHIPQRLLLIGLPLTIVLGFGVGVLLFGSLTLSRGRDPGDHAGTDRCGAGQGGGDR